MDTIIVSTINYVDYREDNTSNRSLTFVHSCVHTPVTNMFVDKAVTTLEALTYWISTIVESRELLVVCRSTNVSRK